MIKKFVGLSLSFFLLSLIPQMVFAQSYPVPVQPAPNAACGNRYITLVNPIRSRALWKDQSLGPLNAQYQLVQHYSYPATWLVQYDTLTDKELVETVKKFSLQNEVGVFLEVSEDLARDASVIYPVHTPWYFPNAVFLSGYQQSERRRLIDTVFAKFKQTYGGYPKSVGAWWIDSYSLHYMQQKYHIAAALIVADQKATDSYGVWGQWWGVPYYPTKTNILVPADSLKNQESVVVLQWAQRHPRLAYGPDKVVSNYSVQANDYTQFGLNTEYFNQVVGYYLDCRNDIGQVTIGLETGQESVTALAEYENQLKALAEIIGLKPVTMSSFANSYKKLYSENPKQVSITDGISTWIMTPDSRKNAFLNESIFYDHGISFADYFVADKATFLKRDITAESKHHSGISLSWGWLISLLIVLLLFVRKQYAVAINGFLLLVAGFGLLIRSHEQFGWLVLYGPKTNFLITYQLLAIAIAFGITLLAKRIKDFALLLLPLVYGLDSLIQSVRYTKINGMSHIGLLQNSLTLIGIGFAKPLHITLETLHLTNVQATSLLKIDLARYWDMPWFTLFVYPVLHVLLALIIWYVGRKLPKRLQIIGLIFLGFLLAWQIIVIFTQDPRLALPH